MSDQVQKALAKLQNQVRSEPKDTVPGLRQKVPEHHGLESGMQLGVGPAVRDAIKGLQASLLADLRFEYLGEMAEEHLWDFVCKCALQRSVNHVPGFMTQLPHAPEQMRCIWAIEHLKVVEAFSVGNVQFLNPEGAHFDVQSPLAQNWDDHEGFAEVRIEGTHAHRAAERARQQIDHALKLLRVALKRKGFSDSQLRFRIGKLYVLPDHGADGWQQADDFPVPMETAVNFIEYLGDDLLDLPGGGDAMRHALLALSWIDQAIQAVSLVDRVLFLFSALEALLGDESGSLKSHRLVFYRVMLGETVAGGFFHPVPLYWFYDSVRSVAVHGDEPPEITKEAVDTLEWNIRNALYEYVHLCKERGLTSRKAVRNELHKDPQAVEQCITWLRANDPKSWFATWTPPGMPVPVPSSSSEAQTEAS